MKKLLVALAAAGLLAACNAQQPPAKTADAPKAAIAAVATDAQLAEVRKVLEERFKGAPIKGLRANVFPGLYEAMIGDDMIYFDAKVNHFVVGNLIEASTMNNLTEARTAELNAIDVKQLPLNDAIKFVRGNGERVMYVFTDVDCPFCTRLERTLQEIDNVTVYNFMFPIDSLHPDATRKQKLIWCAKDRLKAWQDATLNNKLVTDSNTTCANPVDATKALGQKLGIRGTPSFFLADGRMTSGALPKDRLEALLASAQTKLGATK
jgi:thiol:disulfide interchange protein DsbC